MLVRAASSPLLSRYARTSLRMGPGRLSGGSGPAVARLFSSESENTHTHTHAHTNAHAFRVDKEDVKALLTQVNAQFRESADGSRLEVCECTLCDKGNRSKADNQWKLWINVHTHTAAAATETAAPGAAGDGSFHCFRCHMHGNYRTLKRKLLGVPASAAAGEDEGAGAVAGAGAGVGADVSDKLRMQSRARAPSVQKPVSAASAVAAVMTSAQATPKPSSAANPISDGVGLDPAAAAAAAACAFPNQREVLMFPRFLFASQHPAAVAVRDWLKRRGIEEQAALRYGVGVALMQFPAQEAAPPPDEATRLQAAAEAGSGQDLDAFDVPPSSPLAAFEDEVCITFPMMVREDDLTPAEKRALALAQGVPVLAPGVLAGNAAADGASPPPSADAGSETGWISENGWVVKRIKARALRQKGMQRLLPKGGGWALFGWHTVPPEAKEVVLTEGEFDAIAVNQVTGYPAVSLPNGCNSLPTELLPMLERFERIYLWMDNDEPGMAGADKFARKLGTRRCLIVRPLPDDPSPPKDANEALQRKKDMKRMLREARPLVHERIQSFDDLQTQVMQEIVNPQQFQGTQTASLPSLNRILKGFRRGELVVFTGPTGAGKTTLLSQLSLDFARQGAPTLWGSFEIKNTRLIKKMMQQFHKHHALQHLPHERLIQLAQEFSELPLQFLNFHGSTEVDRVLEALDFAVYKHDVRHIFIDNLQFMMARPAAGRRLGGTVAEMMEQQDSMVDHFRRFATEKDVSVVVVIHPRKEDDTSLLGLSSVFGTAKATQEADSVLVLQSVAGLKFLDVKKNRFDGDLGSIPLAYSEVTGSFYEPQAGSMPSSSSQALAQLSHGFGNGSGGGLGGAGAQASVAARARRSAAVAAATAANAAAAAPPPAKK